MGKFNWTELKSGLATLLRRNVVLIILFNTLNMYATFFKNGYRSMLVIDYNGMPATLLGLLTTIFLIVGMLVRTPSGAIVDKMRKNIKYVLIFAIVLKSCMPFVYYFAHSRLTLGIAFVLDGVVWAFAAVVPPALLAIFVDRKAVGSGMAIMEGLWVIATASARGLAANMFVTNGPFMPTLVAAGLQFLCIFLVMGMDNKVIREGVEKQQQAKAERAGGEKLPDQPGKKNGKAKGLAGISLIALPFAIVNALPYFMVNMDNSFNAVYAASMNFDYLTPATIGGSIAGVLNVIIGFACDFINPVFIILAALLGQAAAPFILAGAATSGAFGAGILCYYMTKCFSLPIKVLAIRKAPKGQEGAVTGTIMMFQDLVSIVSSTVCGLVIDKMGYSGAYTVVGCISVLAVGVFTVIMLILPRMHKNVEAAEK